MIGIFAVELALFDEARRVERFGQAGERVAAELLVFVGHGRHQREVLRGDDLVRVNVVAHHVNRSGKNRLHGDNVPRIGAIFQSDFNRRRSGGGGGDRCSRLRKTTTAMTHAVQVGSSSSTGTNSRAKVGNNSQ